MADEIQAYPLTWPAGWKRTRNPERSKFGKRKQHATYSYSVKDRITIGEAVRDLLDELRKMGVSENKVIISTNLKLRLDGLPYSQQKEPSDAGVSVWWKKGEVNRVIALDKYDRIADNIYAVAKTIEALRGIDRWGSGEILERTFTGFDALPPPATTEGWWQVFGVGAFEKSDYVEEVYKKARWKAHPDQGGSSEQFQKVQDAWAAFKIERGLS